MHATRKCNPEIETRRNIKRKLKRKWEIAISGWDVLPNAKKNQH